MLRTVVHFLRTFPRMPKFLGPTFLQGFCINQRLYSDDPKKNFTSITSNDENEDSVIEIYDVPVDQQFDEDPEFDYFNQSLDYYNYPFICPGRASNGVFDLSEIVQFLRSEMFIDIVAIRLPDVACCGDYMVIASANSIKHMTQSSRILQKLFKMKRSPSDSIPNFEGLDRKSDWIAVDLGNIILHMFATKECRNRYDLESLWGIGAEFDLKAQGLDEVEKQSEQSAPLGLTQADWERILAEVAADEAKHS
ncbi:unnamed protein product [Rodentolepis nana]|uniref:Mitochondrial assembly of ribosomal large subunit protein 1 n=1 Tax=Rodentolepis nana TaxID=102285 RepID=A0A0R3TJX5_RODNA|nr:unnamed protein product [Rodentolepis nana]